MKLLLFDFDGVLADSSEAILRVANRLAPQFGYAAVEKSDIENWKHRSARDIIQASGIPAKKLPSWLKKFKRELTHEIPLMRPIPGMEKSLIQITKERIWRTGILSSNSTENVTLFLENNKWQSLIDFIYPSSSLFGKSRSLKKILREEGLAPCEALYIGDEIRDVDAARKAQVRAVAVSWGFNSRQSLHAAHPDFIIDQPSELLDIIRRADKRC